MSAEGEGGEFKPLSAIPARLGIGPGRDDAGSVASSEGTPASIGFNSTVIGSTYHDDDASGTDTTASGTKKKSRKSRVLRKVMACGSW